MSKAFISHVRQAKQIIDTKKKEKALEAGIHVRNKTVEKLSQPGTGKQYLVPGTTNTFYTASSPGRPPAVLFGDLRKSIAFEEQGGSVLVGSDLKKASKLEFGDSKIAARPFLKPTFEEETNNIKTILGKEWFK